MQNIADLAKKYFPNTKLCRCGGAHQICLNCAVCRADEPDELYEPTHGIAGIIDATLLKADAKSQDIIALCEMANQFKTASVCINSFYIPLVKSLLKNVKSCTVINFPLGAGSLEALAAEAEAVIQAKVDEVDMVQNLAALKSGDLAANLANTAAVAQKCIKAGVLLKVILETCYLNQDELILSCLISKKAGAKYVKTSTGFGSSGAKAEDIALMRAVVGPKFGVKASGGIRDKETAQKMIAAGANRIGASSVAALL